MIHKFEGKIVIPERKDTDYEFGIYNNQATTYTNLTDVLNKIYIRDTDSWAGKLISVKIRLDDEYVFDSIGEIYRAKDECGVYDWFIGNDNLGKVLFDLCDSNANIIINEKPSAELNELNIAYEDKKIGNDFLNCLDIYDTNGELNLGWECFED